jgi:hypothetical protein
MVYWGRESVFGIAVDLLQNILSMYRWGKNLEIS